VEILLAHKCSVATTTKVLLALVLGSLEINDAVCFQELCTPLHYACIGNRKKVAELLILKGAAINARDAVGAFA
jgi:ankyrin repeat protein